MESVSAVLGLLLLSVYVFAIIFVTLLGADRAYADEFATVPQAADDLMRMTVCGHDADFIGQLLTTGWYFWLIYMAFVCIGTMMLLNMLIGVLCEVVTTVSTEETEEAFRADV